MVRFELSSSLITMNSINNRIDINDGQEQYKTPWIQMNDGISLENAAKIKLSGDSTTFAITSNLYDSTKGIVKIYKWNSTNNEWTQKGNDIIGSSNEYISSDLSLSDDGNIIVISSYLDDNSNGTAAGKVLIYEWVTTESTESSSSWVQKGSTIIGDNSGDKLGYTIALSGDGTTVAMYALQFLSNTVNVTKRGYVKIYKYDNNVWSEMGLTLNGENDGDNFGISLSLSTDGEIIAIGAIGYDDGNNNNSGYVQIYKWDTTISYPGTWAQKGNDIIGENASDQSGYSVSISGNGNIIAIGSPYYNNSSIYTYGQVIVYEYNSNTFNWDKRGSNIVGNLLDNLFGENVSISNDGTILAIGNYVSHNTTNNKLNKIRIFEWHTSTSSWEENTNNILGDEYFYISSNVSLSNDGSTIATTLISQLDYSIVYGNVYSTISLGDIRINGNVIINGKIGSNNNGTINFGDEGGILTINGNLESMSWNKPYFIKVQLEADDNGLKSDSSGYTNGYYTVGSDNNVPLVKQFSSSDYNFNNTDWSETDSEWTCPSTGMYRFTAQVAFRHGGSNENADLLRSTTIILYNTVQNEEIESNKHSEQSNSTSSTNTNFNIVEINNILSTITNINENDKVELRAKWTNLLSSNANNMRIRGSTKSTFLIIEKII